MPTAMSAAQIAQVAYNAGWRGEELVTATAVALAESSGRYWIVNGIGCVGLWQINVPVHPQYTTADMKVPAKNASAARAIYAGAGNKWTPWEAYTGPDGKGSDGPYTAQMGRARLAAAGIKGATVTPASDTTSTGAGTVDQAAYATLGGTADTAAWDDWLKNVIPWSVGGQGNLDNLGSFLSMGKALISIAILMAKGAAWVANPKNWLRVVEVLGGGVALFIGLRMLANSGIDSPVAGTVKVATDGASKIAKAAKSVAKTGTAAATGGTTAAAAVAAGAVKS